MNGALERGARTGDRATDDREEMVSVVVIARNERDHIGACLESVFAACEPLDQFEVVLVDSRSTDGTVEIASEFPITILRLPEEPEVSPSAGRYVGTQATSGDLVLFVDGDMVLEEGWLEEACRRVRDDPALGGVDGNIEGPFGGETTVEDRPIDVLRGVALYDRAALEAAGGFDPFLGSNEDLDCSFRMAARGYRLVRLSDVVATHADRDVASDKLRRWRLGYYRGRGQLVRKYLTRPSYLARVIRRHFLYWLLSAWLLLGLVATAAVGRRALRAWLAGSALGVTGASITRSPGWTADRCITTVLFFGGVALGTLDERRPAGEYPLDAVEVVRPATERRGPRSV